MQKKPHHKCNWKCQPNQPFFLRKLSHINDNDKTHTKVRRWNCSYLLCLVRRPSPVRAVCLSWQPRALTIPCLCLQLLIQKVMSKSVSMRSANLPSESFFLHWHQVWLSQALFTFCCSPLLLSHARTLSCSEGLIFPHSVITLLKAITKHEKFLFENIFPKCLFLLNNILWATHSLGDWDSRLLHDPCSQGKLCFLPGYSNPDISHNLLHVTELILWSISAPSVGKCSCPVIICAGYFSSEPDNYLRKQAASEADSSTFNSFLCPS